MRLRYSKYTLAKGVQKAKTKTGLAIMAFSLALGGGGGFATLVLSTAHADGAQVIVTPTNTQGWSTSDTRTGGAVTFTTDNSAPGDPHNGSLGLTTADTTTAKAQYLHDTSTTLSDINTLSYYTKQNAPAGSIADPSYQLAVCLTGTGTTGCNPQAAPGTGSSFTSLVFEPYQNTAEGAVANGVWQQWNVAQGQFWSTHTITCSNGNVTGTHGGPASYTLAQINAACPDAVVFQFGVNIGSNNPGYNVETDLINFNGTTYNFEPYTAVSDKDQCKNNGWTSQVDANGNSFKNQGACVSYVASNGKSEH